MNIGNERKLAARAKELGESANSTSFNDLAELTRSESPLVRRLAASALGKLAGIVEAEPSVRTLQPLLADVHPQVRQYAAKKIVGRERLETFPPRLEGRCPFQPYKKDTAFHL